MNIKNSEKLVTAILTIVIGVLMIWLKGEVISIALTIAGAILIIVGVLALVDRDIAKAIVDIVIGVLIIVFGWIFVDVMLIIAAALLIIYGLYDIYLLIKSKTKFDKWYNALLAYAAPVVFIIIGILLLCNAGGVIDWVFIVAGIFAIIDGILLLIESFKKNG